MSKKELIRIYDDEGKLIKKQCGKCGEIKNIEEFYKRKRNKDGFYSDCKICIKKIQKKYYEDNKDKRIEYQLKYNEDNKEKLKEYKKEWGNERKEELKEYKKKYNEKNKEKNKEHKKKYYEENKEYIIEHTKKYYEENKEHLLNCSKQYYNKNRDAILERINKHYYETIECAKNQVYDNFTKNNYPNYDIQYGIIYGVHNKITNRWYIGQTTKNFDIRYNGDFFKNKLKEMNENNKYLLLKDLEEYGEESFEFKEILDVAFSPMELDEKEIYYIDYYEAYNKGYNSNRGYINGRQTLYDTWIKENENKGEIE